MNTKGLQFCDLKAWLYWSFLCLLNAGCATVQLAQPQDPLVESPSFITNVPLLTEQHLDQEFWLQKIADADSLLLNKAQIQKLNQQVINQLDEVIDVFAQPEMYTNAEVHQFILALSHRAAHPRFFQNGTELTDQDWRQYDQLLALTTLPAVVTAQFALVTSRGNLRTYPTNTAVFSSASDQHLDRFQESAVFPGEPLQILHYSLDRQWAFVRHYHYNGWLSVAHFGVTDKTIAQGFVDTNHFIVVTGDRIYTNVSLNKPEISAVALEMGVKLPRVLQPEPVIHGQNSSFSYVVELPSRQSDGRLQLVQALISRNQDLSTDYLPLTKRNILQQAYKFLGEHYGWGHGLNARDCSGFIGEVFRSFGYILPRNTGSQALASFGAVLDLTQASPLQKQQAIKKAQAGDLVFMPGHVMLVLGQDNGETFLIHDVAGLHYFLPDGSLYHSMLNGVSVTPLTPLRRNQQHSYIDDIYMLKSLSREHYADPAN